MQMQAQYQMQQMQQYGSMGGMGGMGGMSTMGSMNGFGMNPWMMGGMGPQSTYGAFPAMSQGGSQMGVGSMAPPQRGQSPQMGAMSPGGMDQVSPRQQLRPARSAADSIFLLTYSSSNSKRSRPCSLRSRQHKQRLKQRTCTRWQLTRRHHLHRRVDRLHLFRRLTLQ